MPDGPAMGLCKKGLDNQALFYAPGSQKKYCFGMLRKEKRHFTEGSWVWKAVSGSTTSP
jgi:hypothetical protein